MKTLDRYLLKETAAPFLIGLAAFLTILCLNMAYFVLDLIVDKEAPLDDICKIIALRVPFYVVLALPVAILLSSSLAMNRITRDRELVALRLGGLSLWRLLLPFAVFGISAGALSYVAQEWAAPKATHESDTMYRRLLLESNVPTLTPDTFFTADNRVFYFHKAYRVAPHVLRMEQVLMFQMNGTSFPDIWRAREAYVTRDVWTLRGVVMHHLQSNGRSSVDGVADGDVVIDLHKDMSLFVDEQKTPEEMTAQQLADQLRMYHRMGITGIGIAPLEYQYYIKFSIPIACLICALVGLPLNIRFARLGGFVGILLALVSIFLYYNFMIFARSLCFSGSMSALVAAWSPDVFFGGICLALILREL